MKMRFMVGVENQELEKNPLVIISKRVKKWKNAEKTQPEKSKRGKKPEKHEKTQPEESKPGEN